jgi:hypothetical protein
LRNFSPHTPMVYLDVLSYCPMYRDNNDNYSIQAIYNIITKYLILHSSVGAAAAIGSRLSHLSLLWEVVSSTYRHPCWPKCTQRMYSTSAPHMYIPTYRHTLHTYIHNYFRYSTFIPKPTRPGSKSCKITHSHFFYAPQTSSALDVQAWHVTTLSDVC